MQRGPDWPFGPGQPASSFTVVATGEPAPQKSTESGNKFAHGSRLKSTWANEIDQTHALASLCCHH